MIGYRRIQPICFVGRQDLQMQILKWVVEWFKNVTFKNSKHVLKKSYI